MVYFQDKYVIIRYEDSDFVKEQVFNAVVEVSEHKHKETEMGALKIYEELKSGGEWLGAARRWMQSNIHRGDTICWGSGELASIPFCKLEELAQKVAIAAVAEDRRKHGR